MRIRCSICFAAVVAAFFFPAFLSAQPDWNTVAAPAVISIAVTKDDPKKVGVQYQVVTGPDGASQALVELLDSSGNRIASEIIGRAKKAVKMIEFAPSGSGRYGVRVTAKRAGEPDKVSGIMWFDFVYPLGVPAVSVLNSGNGTFRVFWKAVHEAEGYIVSYKDETTGQEQSAAETTQTEMSVGNLVTGNKVSVKVAAVRGTESAVSRPVTMTVRSEKDRVWKFTRFGQSTYDETNTMEMLDADNLKFRLKSCIYDPETLAVTSKGGKFTAYQDGVSFYYTVIDAATENFDLQATFTVDYINITPDGQEGFALMAMDRIGKDGDNTDMNYTNSAAVLATKMEEHFGDVKKTSKDTPGIRFVTNITPEVLAMGDSGIAQNGSCVMHAFSYDPSDLVKAGDVYRLRLVKDNSGYRAIFDKAVKSEDTVTEYRLWGPEKLLQLDKDHVYVGFAVARGCNVTVSDVSMKITDPAHDPPRQEEPPQLVPLVMKVDSPATYGESDYPFVFNANADGMVSVKDADGKELLASSPVKASKDFTATFKLNKVFNDFIVTFRPDRNYRPDPRQVIARYNRELKTWEENYDPATITCSVIYLTYKGSGLYVSPEGSALSKGTREDPLDLPTALNYCLPGQPVYLMEGTYYPSNGIIIERGNSGKPGTYKELKADPQAKSRPVLNFGAAKAGIVIWGNWWHMTGFDVTGTPGDVKGLQIGGSSNIVENVDTYLNGDTGLQISGISTEGPDKWPQNNLVLNCTSWGNCDPAQNNADGFAAKLTCGTGNVFRGCISYSNIDDGWDLYAKTETGPIGAVLIENCISCKNGHRPDGTGNGDGNGFKLGGDGIAVPHILKNCIAYGNGASGITSNSNPALIVINDTSYGNGTYNVALYGKGSGNRSFVVKNLLSFEGMQADTYSEKDKGFDGRELESPQNYFWNGAKSLNSEGKVLKASDVFTSTDYKNIVPGRNADGSVDMKGLFGRTPSAPADIGADLDKKTE